MNFEPHQLSVWIKYAVIAVLVLIIGLIIWLWVTLFPRMTGAQSSPAPETAMASETPAIQPTETTTAEPTQTALPSPTRIPVSMELNTVYPEEAVGYLNNPGIGWQHDTGDPGSSRYLPESVAYYRSEFSWKLLNPGEDRFDWPILDQYISLARSEGKDASFRVVTMLGEEYGGQVLPGWVLKKGAAILPTGAPDYSNCVYQEEWSKFVQALAAQYDGHPDVAFIDISGYGNFNEWSWDDSQTEWDDDWANNYGSGITDPAGLSTLDGQARRRLADMFIGGSNPSHQCRGADGATYTVSYNYTGFQKTQLIMPFAGIPSTTQYVYTRRKDVGFRYDCLGRDATLDGLDNELPNIWRFAPVAFEFCGSKPLVLPTAKQLLDNAHGSLVHNNESPFVKEELVSLLEKAGYRFVLMSASVGKEALPGSSLPLEMVWQNKGNAPYYPKMGHTFELRVTLTDAAGAGVLEASIPADIAGWMPADDAGGSAPEYRVSYALSLPQNLAPGEYTPRVYIQDMKTGMPLYPAVTGADDQNRFPLPPVEIR